MCADAPTNTDPARTSQRHDRAYRIAHFFSTSTFIPPPADIADETSEDEEEEDADEDEVDAEEEIPEEGAVPQEQPPEAPDAPVA
jgi:hypothetical protein